MPLFRSSYSQHFIESRFTPAAREAVALARELAARHGHAEVQPLDLLLALLTLKGEAATGLDRILNALNVERGEITIRIEAALTTGKPIAAANAGWSPEISRVLVLATRAATLDEPWLTSPEFLLVGLATHRSGPHYSSVLEPLEMTAANLLDQLARFDREDCPRTGKIFVQRARKWRVAEPWLRVVIFMLSMLPVLSASQFLSGTPGPAAIFSGMFLLWECVFAGAVSFLAVTLSPLTYVRRRGIACLMGLALGLWVVALQTLF